jgi:hypothetical protein
MGLLHIIEALAKGTVSGLQAAQRDWSPYAAHFTSYSAMAPVRGAINEGKRAAEIAALLRDADQKSLQVVQQIAGAGELRANSPSPPDAVPPCVCFSECTLPGLLSLCERYGRFGFVFEKRHLYEVGARPCIYVGRQDYHILARHGRNAMDGTPERRLFGLSNVYSPPGFGQVQDFTHDREWRYFNSLGLAAVEPLMYICPASAVSDMRRLFGTDKIYIPVDIMFAWGA